MQHSPGPPAEESKEEEGEEEEGEARQVTWSHDSHEDDDEENE